MRKYLGAVALATVALTVVASAASAYSNDFESDTAGWGTSAGSTITQQPDSYLSAGGYASGIASASPTNHARLGRGTCTTGSSAGGPFVNCPGPYTYWGDGNNYTWNGPYATQLDIYLDTAYANANPDTYGGNYADLTTPNPSTDPADKGTRFDFTSAINSSTPDGNGDAQHLRDFGFNVSTGYANDGCEGFRITGQTVVNRNNANPNINNYDPQCIANSGWYTFKHSFSSEAGFLKVVMDITPVGSQAPAATWTITGIDADGTYGCNRYGWFSNQEIFGLPIDNAMITGGCAAVPHIGVIAPTATTCQQYRDNETTPMPVLEELLYGAKGTKINAVSPGVFFYYTKVVGGTAGQKVDITQENDATSAPDIPINQGQVVLYDAGTCKVVKNWTPTVSPDGTATGNLPTGGDFIIGVKYNPSALKGADVPVPTTVEYTFGMEQGDVKKDEATIDLVPKP